MEREVVENRGFDSEKAVPAPDEAGRRDGDGRKWVSGEKRLGWFDGCG